LKASRLNGQSAPANGRKKVTAQADCRTMAMATARSLTMFHTIFRDRRDAGRDLAQRLVRYANRPDVTVLALPRGGVPVAAELAEALHAPLDVFVVRKLGVGDSLNSRWGPSRPAAPGC